MAIPRCPALHPAALNALCTLASYFQTLILLHLSFCSGIVGPVNLQPLQATPVLTHSTGVYQGLGRGDATNQMDTSLALRIFSIPLTCSGAIPHGGLFKTGSEVWILFQP